MKVYEFGAEQEKSFAMFQCAAEPWWVFEASAKALAREYHVYLFIADGHDEQGTTFVSIEKTVEDAAAFLRERGVRHLAGAYGEFLLTVGLAVVTYCAVEELHAVVHLQFRGF